MHSSDRRDDNVIRMHSASEEPEEMVELDGTENWLSTETVGPEQLSSERR